MCGSVSVDKACCGHVCHLPLGSAVAFCPAETPLLLLSALSLIVAISVEVDAGGDLAIVLQQGIYAMA